MVGAPRGPPRETPEDGVAGENARPGRCTGILPEKINLSRKNIRGVAEVIKQALEALNVGQIQVADRGMIETQLKEQQANAEKPDSGMTSTFGHYVAKLLNTATVGATAAAAAELGHKIIEVLPAS